MIIKTQYDLILRDLANREGDFRNDYKAYLTYEAFKKEILSNMSKKDAESYIDGAGGELKGEMPSMSSIGSSSRFCYLSLKDSSFEVFGFKGNPESREFEKTLPIFAGKGIPPHMDCFIEDENDSYFFECKCHEQFDSHLIDLSTSYFREGLICSNIKDSYVEKELLKNTTTYKRVSPSLFGVGKSPRFDIKQLLTHIMGIKEKMKKEGINKKAHLCYFYFIPEKALVNKKINSTIEKLIEEAKTVFSSEFIRQHAPEIDLRLYIQFTDTVEKADSTNVRRVI